MLAYLAGGYYEGEAMSSKAFLSMILWGWGFLYA